MRYPHFLTRQKQGKQSGRICTVAVSSEIVPHDRGSHIQRETLTAWSAAGIVVSDGEITARWHDAGTTADGFWQAADYALSRGGNTTVVAYGAARSFGLLGLWEMIETGKLLIYGGKYAESNKVGHENEVPRVQGTDSEGGTDRHTGDTGDTVPVRGASDGVGRAGKSRATRKATGQGVVVIEDPPTVIVVRKAGAPGRLTMIDLRNWGIDCPEQCQCLTPMADWMMRAVIDMLAVMRRREWGQLRTTAGAQALHTYRVRYCDTAIHCHTSVDALELERSAYHGGRCEALRIGRISGRAYHLDYRSMYPYVCSVESLPVRLRGVGHSDESDWSAYDRIGRGVIADVTVETDEPAYPWYCRGEVYWPVGRFRTQLCGPELRDAMQRGRIRQCHISADYDLEPALSQYALDVWAETQTARDAGNAALVQWLKSMSVCLPGKFGQRGSSWEDYPDALPPGPWCQWVQISESGDPVRCRALGWQCQREVKGDWSDDAVPAMAAWITSAGRMRLLRAIRCAGWDHVYYYDTDSVIVDTTGYMQLRVAGLVSQDELGYLRLIEQGDDLQIWGIKHYRLCGNTRCSGVPKGTIEPSGLDGTYWYRDWLKRSVRAGVRPSVMRELRTYARDGAYEHGSVGGDGVVSPWRIDE